MKLTLGEKSLPHWGLPPPSVLWLAFQGAKNTVRTFIYMNANKLCSKHKRVCAGSWLGEKNPSLHWGLPLPSVLCFLLHQYCWLAFQGASMRWPIPAQACVRMCMKMHSITSRFIIRLGNILLAATHVCTSQPGNFTGCGSEGVKDPFFWISSLHYFPVNEPLTNEELSSTTGLCCLFSGPLSGMPVCSIINRNPLQLNSCVRGYFGVVVFFC